MSLLDSCELALGVVSATFAVVTLWLQFRIDSLNEQIREQRAAAEAIARAARR